MLGFDVGDDVVQILRVLMAGARCSLCYDTARKGTLKLSPLGRVLNELERDYEMMEPIFYGKQRPSWKRK